MVLVPNCPGPYFVPVACRAVANVFSEECRGGIVYKPDTVGTRQLIESVITRRRTVLDGLEERMLRVELELSELQQRVNGAQEQRDKINEEVARLKGLRDSHQAEARRIMGRINEVRTELEGDAPIPPDPRWARERLQRGIEELEGRFEISALDRDAERRLMREMRELAHQHSEWVNKRQKNHPEWGVIHVLHRELNEAYEAARTNHEALVQLAEASEPFHEEYLRISEDLKRHQALHLGLLGEREHGPGAVTFWRTLLETGLTEEHEIFADSKKITVSVEQSLAQFSPAAVNSLEESE